MVQVGGHHRFAIKLNNNTGNEIKGHHCDVMGGGEDCDIIAS